MCIVVLLLNEHPWFPVILAHNRDEDRERPAAAASFEDESALFCGRDLKGGGTVLAIDARTGRLAALTNGRVGVNVSVETRISRGHVVERACRGALVGSTGWQAEAGGVSEDGSWDQLHRVDPFKLLCGNLFEGDFYVQSHLPPTSPFCPVAETGFVNDRSKLPDRCALCFSNEPRAPGIPRAANAAPSADAPKEDSNPSEGPPRAAGRSCSEEFPKCRILREKVLALVRESAASLPERTLEAEQREAEKLASGLRTLMSQPLTVAREELTGLEVSWSPLGEHEPTLQRGPLLASGAPFDDTFCTVSQTVVVVGQDNARIWVRDLHAAQEKFHALVRAAEASAELPDSEVARVEAMLGDWDEWALARGSARVVCVRKVTADGKL